MALDIDALRRKLNQLTGQNKKSNLTWRPEEGREYQIRILAFPNNDGQPFVDRWYYYGIGGTELSLEEIGEELNLTRERVRQIKEKAIRRLRHSSKNKLLKKYLG